MKNILDRKLKTVRSDRFKIELNMPKNYPAIKTSPTELGGVRERFMAAKAELPDEITVVRPYDPNGFEKSAAHTFHVSADGCDECGDGSEKSPLGTLHAALEKVRGLGGAKIVLHEGVYNFDSPAVIDAEMSGTEESPLIIMSADGECAYLSASHRIPSSAFKPVTDEAVLARLKPEVRAHVLKADLNEIGIKDFGVVGYGGAVLQYNNEPQILARYPNVGEKQITMSEKIYEVGSGRNDEEDHPWEIGITDPHCLEWQWNDDIWLFGALFAEWARRYAQIGSFNREKMSMRGLHGFGWDGVQYNEANDYYFLNVFEELDAPGEWYLDRNSGILYFYPPNGALTENDVVSFIAKPCNLIECKDASNVIIDRLDAGRCMGSAIFVCNCHQVLVQRCHVTGTCGTGEDSLAAVEIAGGSLCGAIATTVEHFTATAMAVSGGDRINLIPSNNFIQNCFLINPHYRHGLRTGGCGNIVSHNYVHNTTTGDCGHNEGIFEYNIVEGGDTETHDTGMMYVAGGGCSTCGNHFRYNYFFDFAEGDYGIYFDDLSRGMYAYGNIVVGNGTTGDGTTWHSGGRSFNAHNGGEHCFYNNISIDAGYFAFGGDVTYWLFDGNWNGLYPGIRDASLDKRGDTYMGRYPTYRDYVAAIDQYEEDLHTPGYVRMSGWAERRLRTPWCNHYENNLIFRAARPYKLDHGIETATGLETNYITNEDPGFEDLDGRDYRIKPDAPLFKEIPDFVPPPFEKMGPVDDFS